MNQDENAPAKVAGTANLQVSPPEVDVPIEDPFANDLLMCHDRARALKELIERASPRTS